MAKLARHFHWHLFIFLVCSCYIKNGMRKGTASAAKTDIKYEQGAAGANK